MVLIIALDAATAAAATSSNRATHRVEGSRKRTQHTAYRIVTYRYRYGRTISCCPWCIRRSIHEQTHSHKISRTDCRISCAPESVWVNTWPPNGYVNGTRVKFICLQLALYIARAFMYAVQRCSYLDVGSFYICSNVYGPNVSDRSDRYEQCTYRHTCVFHDFYVLCAVRLECFGKRDTSSAHKHTHVDHSI